MSVSSMPSRSSTVISFCLASLSRVRRTLVLCGVPSDKNHRQRVASSAQDAFRTVKQGIQKFLDAAKQILSTINATLVAATVRTFTFDVDYNSVEVLNVDGAAAIYFTVDGTTILRPGSVSLLRGSRGPIRTVEK